MDALRLMTNLVPIDKIKIAVLEEIGAEIEKIMTMTGGDGKSR